jgi:hypothetical protein
MSKKPQFDEPPTYLSIDAAAFAASVSRSTVKRLIPMSYFATIRLGRRKLIERASFLRWLASNQHQTLPSDMPSVVTLFACLALLSRAIGHDHVLLHISGGGARRPISGG